MATRVLEKATRVFGEESQDASMEESGRPPGVGLIPLLTYAEKVQSSAGGGRPIPEKVLDEEFVASRMRLEFPNGDDGEGVVTIGQEVISAMTSLWKNCMIVKVLGRNVPLAPLLRKLRELWAPKGGMTVIDLPRQFFLVRFELEDDYMGVVTGGPWRLFGSLLMFQAWSPSFNPMQDEIETTPVWVRISNLPVHYYHKTILMGIAEALGKPLRADLTTLQVERARFARVCIEVNLKKPLKGSVMVNGERYMASYEGLNTICSSCGIYGHLASVCPKRLTESVSQLRVQHEEKQSGGRGTVTDAQGFTVIRRTGPRALAAERTGGIGSGESDKVQERNAGEIRQSPNSGKVPISNSFSGLTTDSVADQVMTSMEVTVHNKENVNMENIPTVVMRSDLGKGSIKTGRELRVQSGNRGGGVMKKTNGPKGGKGIGPRSTSLLGNRPTRGLIFGPVLGEQSLAASGKRLRSEQADIGRDGGVSTSAWMPSGNIAQPRVVEASTSPGTDEAV
ncbi:hypothetical protein CARUB_v10025024mg, partial [Capsella rubella]